VVRLKPALRIPGFVQFQNPPRFRRFLSSQLVDTDFGFQISDFGFEMQDSSNFKIPQARRFLSGFSKEDSANFKFAAPKLLDSSGMLTPF
jgi:hypothetical protein